MRLHARQVLALGFHGHLLELLLAQAADVDLAALSFICVPNRHKVGILYLLLHLGDIMG